MEKKRVIIRDLTLGDGTPKICIPVTARTTGELKKQTEKIKAGPCEMVELRADYFEGNPLTELEAFREQMPKIPLLFTYRTKEEGGEGTYSPQMYARLNLDAADSKMADLIDLELNRGESQVSGLLTDLQQKGIRVILSFHDFISTPDEDTLIQLICRMQRLGADISKIAVMPQKDEDVLQFLSTAVKIKKQAADRPYILISMGELGSISRLAGSLTGTAVTFASAGASSAPGQLDASFVELCRQKI